MTGFSSRKTNTRNPYARPNPPGFFSPFFPGETGIRALSRPAIGTRQA